MSSSSSVMSTVIYVVLAVLLFMAILFTFWWMYQIKYNTSGFISYETDTTQPTPIKPLPIQEKPAVHFAEQNNTKHEYSVSDDSDVVEDDDDDAPNMDEPINNEDKNQLFTHEELDNIANEEFYQ